MENKLALNRENPRGKQYYLVATDDGKTIITRGTKQITVNVEINEVSQRWFYWQIMGKKIQEAFDNLSLEEREFLITGMLPEQWKETFPEDKSEHDKH
jgi:hypothetical protein